MTTFHHSTQLPRLVVTDLDGTLLAPDHKPTLRSIKALVLAQSYPQQQQESSNNHDNTPATTPTSPPRTQIMIASGRSPRSIQKVIDQFHGLLLPDAVLCCNGALTFNPRTKEISFPLFVPLDQAIELCELLEKQIMNVATKKGEFPGRVKEREKRMKEKAKEDVPAADQFETAPAAATDGKKHKQGQEEETDDDDEEIVQGRPGFACEVVYFSKDPNSSLPFGSDTFFICDKTWQEERQHSIYYDYTVVDSMVDFMTTLQTKHLGGIIKLMALDRNRIASAVYEALPHSIRHPLPSPSTPSQPSSSSSSPAATTSAVPRQPLMLTYSGPYFLEISGPGVTKGLGLEHYCKGHHIPQESVAAFGDLLNDAEMLQFAGLGLCMGNGHEEMKKLADRVIGTNAEDGLAKEIESWYA